MQVSVKAKWGKGQKARPLLIGKTVIYPGDSGEVSEVDLEKFCKGPAGEWYKANALELPGEALAVEAEPEKVEAETKKVDWAHAESLETKDELEAYAREFGVELKKNFSLENMLEHFMEAMEG